MKVGGRKVRSPGEGQVREAQRPEGKRGESDVYCTLFVGRLQRREVGLGLAPQPQHSGAQRWRLHLEHAIVAVQHHTQRTSPLRPTAPMTYGVYVFLFLHVIVL